MSYNVNPIEFITQIKQGKNPSQLMLNFLEMQAAQNPLFANLL
jgi:hypothetical protein